MGSTDSTSDNPLQRRPKRNRCPYCKAPLNKALYFCEACGTPYQDERHVLPRVPAPHLTEGELVRLKAPRATKLFWLYFALVLGTAFISELVFEEERADLAFLFQTGAMFGVTAILTALHWGTLYPQLSRFGFMCRQAWLALAVLIPLLVLNFSYHSLISQLDGVILAEPWESMREHGFDWTTILFGLAVFPAVTEEIAFRGLLQQWLEGALKPWRAILLTAALFTVLHFSVLSAPYLFLLGILLGWVKWQTGSLYPAMVVHFIHNAVAITMM